MPVTDYAFQRGGELSLKSATAIPASTKLRCLQDYIIVEPIEEKFSETVAVVHEIKPLRGVVKAVGPGHYPRRYDHPEKHKRTKMWRSQRFQPTEVQVGQTVQLGGLNYGGYNFDSFLWGDKVHLCCREADVIGIEDAPMEEGRAA